MHRVVGGFAMGPRPPSGGCRAGGAGFGGEDGVDGDRRERDGAGTSAVADGPAADQAGEDDEAGDDVLARRGDRDGDRRGVDHRHQDGGEVQVHGSTSGRRGVPPAGDRFSAAGAAAMQDG
jgi:hypothetical protein